jgi:hypothetical protein
MLKILFFACCGIDVICYETNGRENSFLTLIAVCNSRVLENKMFDKMLNPKRAEMRGNLHYKGFIISIVRLILIHKVG